MMISGAVVGVLTASAYSNVSVCVSADDGEASDDDLLSDQSDSDGCQYELIGVTVHTGTADGGHYYSFIRDRLNKNELGQDRWYDAHIFHTSVTTTLRFCLPAFSSEVTSCRARFHKGESLEIIVEHIFTHLRNAMLVTTRSELCKGSVFGTLCDFFVCVWNISGTTEQFAPNSQGRHVWSLAQMSLNVKVKRQGQKTGFSEIPRGITKLICDKFTRKTCLDLCSLLRQVWRSRSISVACMQFMFGKTSLL